MKCVGLSLREALLLTPGTLTDLLSAVTPPKEDEEPPGWEPGVE